jgi:hypothetical protein
VNETYHFGLLERELRLYAYPRVGSHFFAYALTGLFDIVTPPHEYLRHQEAIDRKSELNSDVLYALSLRDPRVPFRPLRLNAVASGVHGLPLETEHQMVLLIRDPIATAYSRYRVERDRWGGVTTLSVEWLRNELSSYTAFYQSSLEILQRQARRGLLMRWECLVESPAELERLVEFVGIEPKLRPSYVWNLLNFDNLVKAGRRTFYRSGSNKSWMADADWINAMAQIGDFSFERFGYGSLTGYLTDGLQEHEHLDDGDAAQLMGRNAAAGK